MRNILLVLFCSLLAFRVAAQNQPVLPTSPGFYILVKGVYQPLIPAPIQSIQPKIGRAILNSYSLGLAGNRVVVTVPGGTSPVQTGARPTFLLVNASRAIASTAQIGGLNPRALEIVKLDKNKSHREVNIMHGTSWNPSIGLPDPKWPFTIAPVGESAYQFNLPSDLRAGEYLVLSGMFADGYNGFDFTVNPEIQSETPAMQAASSAPVQVVQMPPVVPQPPIQAPAMPRAEASGTAPLTTTAAASIPSASPTSTSVTVSFSESQKPKPEDCLQWLLNNDGTLTCSETKKK